MDIKQKLINSGLNSSSANVYINSLIRIQNKGKLNNRRKYDDTTLNVNVLNDKKDVMKYINSNDVPINSKKILLNSVVNILKVTHASKPLINYYQEQFNSVASIADNARIYAKANEKELQNHMTMDEIMKVRDEYKDKLKTKYHAKYDYPYVLLCLYTYMPPLRITEWIDTKLFNGDAPKDYKENYINLNTGKMYVRVSKTSKTYGERVFDINNELLEILKNNMVRSQSNSVLPLKYDKDKKTNESNVYDIFKNIFKSKLSVQMLRKIYISQLIDDGADAKTRKRVANIMGHSPSTQIMIYSKFSKQLHG